MRNTPNAIKWHRDGCWHFTRAHITTCKSLPLTELVTDALVLQQGGMLEGVPAVQDPGAPAQRGDAAQRQHRVVDEQGRRLLSEPSQHWAVAAVLGVTEDQNLPSILLLAWKTHNTDKTLEKSPNLLLRFRRSHSDYLHFQPADISFEMRGMSKTTMYRTVQRLLLPLNMHMLELGKSERLSEGKCKYCRWLPLRMWDRFTSLLYKRINVLV